MNYRKYLAWLAFAFAAIAFASCAHADLTISPTVTLVIGTNTVVTNTVAATTNTVYNGVAPADPPPAYTLQLADTNWLEMVTPTNLNLVVYATKTVGTGHMPSTFNFSQFDGTKVVLPTASKLVVSWASGATTALVSSVDFKRACDYQLNQTYLFRIRSELALGLTNAIPDNAVVTVTNPDGTVFTGITAPFSVTASTNRWNRAIHVTQLGFVPAQPKWFYVSNYRGTNMMETPIAASTFYIYDVGGLSNAFTGTLALTKDLGSNATVPPNQKVLRGDFTSLQAEGVYRVYIPGLGVSTDFSIKQDNYHAALKLYELGEFNQRCGPVTKGPPYSSWKSDWCHTNSNNFAIGVQVAGQSNNLHWADIASEATYDDGVWNTAHLLTGGFPALRSLFLWKGTSNGLNTQGGHHDAADYSKYTPNICMNCVNLIDGVDVAHNYSDDLGIPESGNGIPDLAEEAKWDADYLLKIMDTDGGVAFLLYPSDKTYENNAPDKAQQQVLYPKTVTSTAQAAAALYVMGTSPTVKAIWPDAATNYTTHAELAFGFVTNCMATYGATNAYDIVYKYSIKNGAQDEYAAMYAGRFLYTKNTNDVRSVKAWIPDFDSSSIKYFSWWPNYEFVGVASQALATSIESGRVTITDFGAETATFANTTNAIHQDALRQIQMCDSNAFNYPYEFDSKRVSTTPYSFSGRTAKMLATDYQIQKFHNGTANVTNIYYTISGLNWDLGGNPNNKSHVYGFGLQPPRTAVDQWGRFTNRQENGPTGAFRGSLNQDTSGGTYIQEVRQVIWPKYSNGGEDTMFPITERGEDIYYVGGERTVDVQGMTVFQRAWLDVATRTNSALPTPKIIFQSSPKVGVSQTLTALVPGIDTSLARHSWWCSGDQQRVTRQLAFTPISTTTNVTVEILMPNGITFSASTNVTIAP